MREEWCLASARQQVYAGELRFLRSDGTVRWALAFASPERHRDGSFNGYIGTITDVTGRLQAERVIESQNRVLEMIAKGFPLAETLTTLLRSVEEQAPGMKSSILLLDADGIHLRHAPPSLPAGYVRALDGVQIGERAGPAVPRPISAARDRRRRRHRPALDRLQGARSGVRASRLLVGNRYRRHHDDADDAARERVMRLSCERV